VVATETNKTVVRLNFIGPPSSLLL
jgi:hypothetical protein